MRRHPWILSGSVASVDGDPQPGDTVVVRSADGVPLGRAAYSPASRLRARMWTFDSESIVDETFIAERVAAAVGRRVGLGATTDAMRLVFSEADGLPGIIVDRYASVAVVQNGTPGADRWREVVADALLSVSGIDAVVERSDTDARALEQLSERNETVRGAPADEVIIHEGALRFAVAVSVGQKTGFYLDQRNARRAIADVAAGARVLNAFSYTGAFSVAALRAGAASVTELDSSSPALAGARRNAELNEVRVDEQIDGDAFAELRRLRDRARQFDLILLDPPRLAPTEAHVARATRAYKDLNLLAIKLLASGGTLMTFSCSGGLSEELFQKVVAGAALDAKRDVRIVGRLSQPSDHPVPLAFPEAAYLKGLVLRAD